jgi:hypothetical protein
MILSGSGCTNPMTAFSNEYRTISVCTHSLLKTPLIQNIWVDVYGDHLFSGHPNTAIGG